MSGVKWGVVTPGVNPPPVRQPQPARPARKAERKKVDLTQYLPDAMPYLFILVNAGRVFERQSFNIDGMDMIGLAESLHVEDSRELKDLLLKLAAADQYKLDKGELVDQLAQLAGTMLLRALSRYTG